MVRTIVSEPANRLDTIVGGNGSDPDTLSANSWSRRKRSPRRQVMHKAHEGTTILSAFLNLACAKEMGRGQTKRLRTARRCLDGIQRGDPCARITA